MKNISTVAFSDKLRAAVKNAPITRYAMSKTTGIHESALSRFVSGGSGLSLANLDKLAALLGWDLVIASAATGSRRKRKGR